jgi:hypothetical protein
LLDRSVWLNWYPSSMMPTYTPEQSMRLPFQGAVASMPYALRSFFFFEDGPYMPHCGGAGPGGSGAGHG